MLAHPLESEEQLVKYAKVFRPACLGYEERVRRPAVEQRFEISAAPWRVQRIGTHDHFLAAEVDGVEPVANHGARIVLAIGCHGVLEIEDEGIRRQRERFFEHARVGAGDEVQGATQAGHEISYRLVRTICAS